MIGTENGGRSGVPQPSIICVSDLFWDEHWSSEQQLMSRFAKRCRVLYVERPVSLLSFFTGTSDGSVARQFWRWLKGGIRMERENLFVLTPPPCLPFRYHRVVNKINQWIRLGSIKRATKRRRIEDPVLWIYEPDAGALVGKLRESLSLYYCADDWSTSGQWWNRSKDVCEREFELARKVDLVVGTARKIAERWQSVNANTFFVPNAADVEMFRRARDPDLNVPEEIQRIPAPRIGYVGVVNARLDVALYDNLTEKRPDWHWVVVGPLIESSVDLSRLKKRSNVHFLGARPRTSLPSYLKGFDVCTIPYICSAHTESIFPLKLFEYLAAGRPVVATPLPELLPYRDYVRIAATPQEFETHVSELLHTRPQPAPREFLEQNSWDARVEVLSSLLTEARSSQA
jgi:glycosyltransferase involved in cell wall biosynthesis